MDSGEKKKKKKKKSKDSDYIVVVPRSKHAGELEKTKLADLKSHTTLGVGTFSRVNLVEHKRTGKTCKCEQLQHPAAR